MGASVLVVDDDDDICDLLSFRLEQAGFDVQVTGDGVAALAAIGQHRPDVVILDISLPGMSGLDVCRLLRADPATADIAIIVLTGRAHESDVEFGFDCGADDYVVKPFSLRELLSRVQRQLARSGT